MLLNHVNNRDFADIIAYYYFAEDSFAIRNEAYDDMLYLGTSRVARV
jgi:hypothetical protein